MLRRLFPCALLALAVACAIPPPHVDPPPAVAALAFTTTDLDTGKPIEGATVHLHTGETCATNADGYCGFAALPFGPRHVETDAVGYLSGDFDVPEFTANLQIDVKIQPIRPPRPLQRAGLVKLEGRTFADAGGQFLGLGASVFWAAWAYTHDREKLDRNLAWLADLKCERSKLEPCTPQPVDYIRVFGSVDGASWADRAIGPEDPDYAGTIAGLTDHAYDDFGLRVEWSILAGAPQDSPERNRNTVEAFAWMARGREHKIAYFEIANENNGPGSLAELRALTRQLQDQTDVLVAASTPTGYCDKYTEMYGGGVGDFITVRTDRSQGENGWRHARQPWEAIQFCGGVPLGASDDEPIGPRSSVAMDDDPWRLAMHAADDYLSGVTAFVYHSGPGVRGGGRWDVAPPTPSFWAPRESNLYEVPRGAEILRAIYATRAALPAGLPNWRKANGHWADAPLHPDAFWTDGADHGVTRAHGAYDGDRFVSLFFAIKRFVDVRAVRACTFKVIRPTDGAVLREVSLAAGEVHRLEEADGPGLIAVGQFR